MGIVALVQRRKRRRAWVRRVGPSLLLILFGLVLLGLVTNAMAGGAVDVCTLVSRADVKAVFGRPVVSVNRVYRGPEAIQQLRTFLREEDLRQEAQRTGMDFWALVEEVQCEYEDLPDAVAADLRAYPTQRLVTSVGRVRDPEEATKVFRRVCRGEYQPSRPSQPLAGIGDGACAFAPLAVIVVKNEFLLSLTLPVFKAGSREPVDLKALAVKAVSRLPGGS